MNFKNPHKNTKPFLKIIFNTGWLTIIRAIGDLSGLALYAILSRYYGPEGIGIYAFGFSIAIISFALVSFGYIDYGIRECTLIDKSKRRKLIGEIIASQLAILLFVLIVFVIFLIITSPSYKTVIVIASLFFNQIGLAFAKSFFIPANAQQSMVFPAAAELLTRIFGIVTTIILVVFFHTQIHIALLSYPISAILLLVLSLYSVKRYNGFEMNFNWRNSFSLMKLVWPFSTSTLFNQIYGRIGLIILTFLLGDAIAGIYAPALKVMEVALMPVYFSGFSVYPVMSKYYEQNFEKFIDSSEKYFRITFILGSLLLWCLFYIIPMLMTPLFGEKFTETATLVKYFAGLMFLFSFSGSLQRILLATHLQVERVKYQLASLVIVIIFDFILIPLWGAKGAVIALIISEFSKNIFFVLVINKNLNVLYTKLLKTSSEFLILFSFPLIIGIIFSYFVISQWFSMSLTLILFLILLYISKFFDKLKFSFSK